MTDLGDVYRIRVTVSDPDGVPMDPASATLTITLPDGTSVSPTVNLPSDGTGVVVVDYPTVQAGRHAYVLTTTGPQTAYRDVFDVRQAELHQIISLRSAKSHLRITNDGSDDDLRGFIEAATSIIEFRTGAAVVRTFTETHQVNSPTVALRQYPVLEVLAVGHSHGTVVDPSTVAVDELGILRGAPRGLLTVTYRAGHSVIPAAWVQAAKIIVQHMWDTQRPKDSQRPRSAYAEETMSVADAKGRHYSIPRRAIELVEPEMVPKTA